MSSGRSRCLTIPALSALVVMILSGVGLADERLGCHEIAARDTRWTLLGQYQTANSHLRRIVTSNVTPRFRAPSLKASAGYLDRENQAAERDDLSRMHDLHTVARFRVTRLLVPLPEQTQTYYVAGVAPSLRVTRPWTMRFVEQLAAAHYRLSGTRLRITSLTRTTKHQATLRLTNINAAPARGPVRSTHLTGASVDISKRGLSASEIAWLRAVLDGFRTRGLIHAIEEFGQPHFHVMVRRSYSDLTASLQRGGCLNPREPRKPTRR